MFHHNQKPARQLKVATKSRQVGIPLLGTWYRVIDLRPEGGLSSPAPSSSQSAPSTPKTAASRKTPGRKIGAQPTRLEAVDGSHDPLGSLGGDAPFTAAAEQAPTPPRKELAQNRNVRPSSSASQTSFGKGSLDSTDRTSDSGLPVRQKGPPPVQPPTGGPFPRQTQPSMSIEQAAKPSFDITVGDPHKVGDITSSHIVYQVQTKASPKGSFRKIARILITHMCRQHRRRIAILNLRSHDDTVISSGCITPFTTTIPALLYRHLLRSKPSVVLTPISSSHAVPLLSACSTRSLHILSSIMTPI
jgi:hypothetical protein